MSDEGEVICYPILTWVRFAVRWMRFSMRSRTISTEITVLHSVWWIGNRDALQENRE
jgi:hypothetical protein